MAVTTNDKRHFINWFLSTYKLAKKEALWLINYLVSDDKLLEKVHFVDKLNNLPKGIWISTTCANRTPFKFYKNNRVIPNIQTAFLDIRSNPNEDVYIALMFKDRDISPEYAAVLEGNPMDRQNLVKDTLLELMAELILDRTVCEFNKHQLYEAIDIALQQNDKKRFMELSTMLNKVLEAEGI